MAFSSASSSFGVSASIGAGSSFGVSQSSNELVSFGSREVTRAARSAWRRARSSSCDAGGWCAP